MRLARATGRTLLPLALLCLSPGRPAVAQEPADARTATGVQGPGGAPSPVATRHALARIREALSADSVLELPDDALRFYVEVVERGRTWEEYMEDSNHPFAITTIAPPSDRPAGSALGGGTGIDLLGVLRSVRSAYREREARQIRERIDRELQALEEARAATE